MRPVSPSPASGIRAARWHGIGHALDDFHVVLFSRGLAVNGHSRDGWYRLTAGCQIIICLP